MLLAICFASGREKTWLLSVNINIEERKFAAERDHSGKVESLNFT